MSKNRSKKQSVAPRSNANQSGPAKKARHQEDQSKNARHDPWSHRFRSRIATANKAVLAAVGAGILGAITAGVVGLPHLAASLVHARRPALEVAGGTSSGKSEGGLSESDTCILGGEFLLPESAHIPRAMSPSQVNSLTSKATIPGSTSGTYTLQASPGQVVVVTAVHTILIRRVPAPLETDFEVMPNCAAAGAQIINLSINLDKIDPSPKIEIQDPNDPDRSITLNGMQTTVTSDSPIIVNFVANTEKYDVTWEIKIDYTVNGQLRTALIANDSQPFHTIAARPDDSELIASPNPAGTVWNVSTGSFRH